ncbi:hypothetical protein JOD43_001389 [Pullulanibacillus pueri]|nr:hypothetical protein [Pullulanibacillus pueri]
MLLPKGIGAHKGALRLKIALKELEVFHILLHFIDTPLAEGSLTIDPGLNRLNFFLNQR